MRDQLRKIMEPESVVFFGASNSVMTPGTNQLVTILANGFRGRVYPVHLREDTVLGLKAYKSVRDIPEAADVAVIILPKAAIPGVLRECAEKGIRQAVIISAGFSETGNTGDEDIIKKIADENGIAIIGPNCIGVFNIHKSFNCTWFLNKNEPGGLSIVSQSGSYVTHMLPYFAEKGICVSKGISVGNMLNTDLADCLDYLKDDPETKSVALYVEGIPSGEKFMRAAREITREKPVVAYYVSGSEAGARSSASHTGAIGGPAEIYEAVFRQTGIMHAKTIMELYDFAYAMSLLPMMNGNRVAIVSNSGGPAASLAHASNLYGFDVPLFSDDLQKKLRAIIPPVGSTRNPMDYTMSLDMKTFLNSCLELILQSGEIDAVLLYGVFDSSHITEKFDRIGVNLPIEPYIVMLDETMKEFAAIIQRQSLPVIISTFFCHTDSRIDEVRRAGIPVFEGPERAAAALYALRRYSMYRMARENTKERI